MDNIYIKVEDLKHIISNSVILNRFGNLYQFKYNRDIYNIYIYKSRSNGDILEVIIYKNNTIVCTDNGYSNYDIGYYIIKVVSC